MFKVKNLQKEVLNKDKKPIKEEVVSIDSVIQTLMNKIPIDKMINILEKQKEKCKKIILKNIYENAVLYEKGINDPDEKLFRYKLWKNINNADNEIIIEDKAMKIIKDSLSKNGANIMIYGQAIENLEDAEEVKDG